MTVFGRGSRRKNAALTVVPSSCRQKQAGLSTDRRRTDTPRRAIATLLQKEDAVGVHSLQFCLTRPCSVPTSGSETTTSRSNLGCLCLGSVVPYSELRRHSRLGARAAKSLPSCWLAHSGLVAYRPPHDVHVHILPPDLSGFRRRCAMSANQVSRPIRNDGRTENCGHVEYRTFRTEPCSDQRFH